MQNRCLSHGCIVYTAPCEGSRKDFCLAPSYVRPCLFCTELTAQDCLFMGKHAYNAGAYARAVEWFEQSFVLAGLESNQTIRQDHVLEFLQQAVRMVSSVTYHLFEKILIIDVFNLLLFNSLSNSLS